MLEQRLAKLQSLSVNERTKQLDWEKINEKQILPKKLFWKETFALITIFAIALILFLPATKQEPLKSAAPPQADIKDIYTIEIVMNSDVDPISNFYPYVVKTRAEGVEAFQNLLHTLIWEQLSPPDKSVYTEKVKMTYEDGTERLFLSYTEGSNDYLYDTTTGFGYVMRIEEQSDTLYWHLLQLRQEVTILNAGPRFIMAFVFIGLSIAIQIAGYLYFKMEGYARTPKPLSSLWQWAVFVVISLSMLGITLWTQQVHAIWWLVLLFVNIAVFILLDKRTEHLKWRVLNVVSAHFLLYSLVFREIYFLI